MVTETPSVDQVWDWLGDVPDPEIPAISLVDLGIIRDVTWQGEMLEVTVTPTYSGCPATRIINLDIETALRDRGIEQITLKRQLSPAWTTDWLSESGKAKLEAYGIAPPKPQVDHQNAHTANPQLSKRSVNSDQHHAKHNGVVPTVWNPSTILSVYKPWHSFSPC